MKSFYAYIRVSTVKQGEHGCSLEEQKAAIEAYAQRHALPISEWFCETDTAAKQGRREFNRMTALLKRGEATGAIIHKIDRGARNLKDWAGLGDLIDAGIDVRFAHEGLDLQTRGGRLAADIQAVVAADFIRNLRQEVRKGFYGRLKQGFYPLGAPRGYLNNGRARPKTIDPVEGSLVARAFELYATGCFSLELLRHELASLGLAQRSGKPLSLNGLSKLLHNPFYVGLIRLGTTGETFQGNHHPLVAKAMFDRVQQILSGRLYPRVEIHRFRYRRLVTCRACGRSLTGERQKGHVYYRCHERACRGVIAAEPAIEAAILETLSSLRIEGDMLADLRALFECEIDRERAEQGQAADHIEREIGAIDARLGRLTDALVDGLLDKPSYDARKTELLHQRRALRDRLESGADSTFWTEVSQWFELGLTAYSGYVSASDDRKREAVETFGSNLIVDGKTPQFAMRFPYNEIAGWAKTQACDPRRRAVRTKWLRKRLAANDNEQTRKAMRSPSKPQVPERKRFPVWDHNRRAARLR